ncbi:hypothetical protein NU10_11355 [Flavobacterium dauae]|uniref:hypothetical protein n=1 Tax=Flavobacterium dauae TaxID=1563479 RepID=UPI00101B3DCC|nr:hypothetical protein [Flavobacterium dauae]WLD23299.1 hypothetical protein NU10_11355 [Flavobacterium dauae]
MKKIFFSMFLLPICLLGCSSTEDGDKPAPFPDNLPVNLPDIPCQDWNIQVVIGQNLRLVNNSGEWSDLLDLDNVSLSAVDKDGNLQYTSTGMPITDMINLAEVIKIYDEQNELDNLLLKFGYVYEETQYNYAVSYFKLKINENRIDDITVYYDIRCGNGLIYKIMYNDVGYMADDWNTIDILIE